MNYNETISYIHATPKFSRVLVNDILRKLLFHLGNPEKKLRFIHIGGTNGKGSTAAMCESILRHSGYKTGLFTSPYIEVYNERIRVMGENISDTELAEIVTEIRNTIEENDVAVSEFALGYAAALVYFAKAECDYVILEAGMGGLSDATNVIEKAEVTVLTSISFDHSQYLGDTVEKIATEKCGIIKENATVVSYMPQNEEALCVIKNACAEKNSRLILCDEPIIRDNGFVYKDKSYTLSLRGSYQPYNAATAIEAVSVLKRQGADITEEAILKGLAATKWAARFEFLSDRLIIDGSHNIDGIHTLAESLKRLDRPVTLVIAMLEDKNHSECISYIAPFADRIVAAQIDEPRCLDAMQTAAETMRVAVIERTLESAINNALAFDDNIVCVCGSLYAAGDARRMYNAGKLNSK